MADNAVKVPAAALRAMEVIKRVAELEAPAVAEIGVYKGDMSLQLLMRHHALKLFMVDSWGGEVSEDYVNTGDFMAKMPQSQHDWAMECAMLRTEFAGHRTVVFRDKSVVVAGQMQDGKLDLVFIDGDHSYTGTKGDIEAWKGKVKPGGWLGGHDYRTDLNFGVKQAVDEFVAANGLELERGDNHTWFVSRTW